MEITWYGHSCFRITERGLGTVVCDPYDTGETGFEPLKLKADIITTSTDSPHHRFIAGVRGAKTDPFVIESPGEYEVNHIFVDGFQDLAHPEESNTVFSIEMNGIFVVHLGKLNHVPTMSEIENFGSAHILMIPVGGNGALSASQAVELISMVKPNVVIPMAYSDPLCKIEFDPLGKFLKEMGISQTEDVMNSFKISGKANLPEETKVVILNHPLSSAMTDDETGDESGIDTVGADDEA